MEVVCTLLELDYQIDVVARVGDGAEAIEAVAKLRPDAVLMDVDMPLLDGLNAAMVISTRFPETRIVLMTAFEYPGLRAEAQACGAVVFIDKTMFREELPQALGIPPVL
jgi:two-component system response regulator DesR